MNAPAYCSTNPAAPPIPQAPLRSPTPAESAQDFDEDLVAFFGVDFDFCVEAGVDDDAAARRDERRAGVGAIFFFFFDRNRERKVFHFPFFARN